MSALCQVAVTVAQSANKSYRALNLDRTARRVYEPGVGASRAPGIFKTAPRPSPAHSPRAYARQEHDYKCGAVFHV
jgi:hypothetical protein